MFRYFVKMEYLLFVGNFGIGVENFINMFNFFYFEKFKYLDIFDMNLIDVKDLILMLSKIFILDLNIVYNNFREIFIFLRDYFRRLIVLDISYN